MSRRLLGAFFITALVLAGAGMIVNLQVTTASIEARANSQLSNDEAIVGLRLAELEKRVAHFGELLADAEILTEQLGPPSVTRSLTISLLSDLRREQMSVRLYRGEPDAGDPNFPLVRKGFLGIRSTSLATALTRDGWRAKLVSITPIEGTSRVERVVSVSFPLTPDYLSSIREHIASDITLLFPDNRVISTLSAADAAVLAARVDRARNSAGEGGSFLLETSTADTSAKTRVSPFLVNMNQEGRLLLTMPMGDLLAARRAILTKGLIVTAAVLFVATFLYLWLIRRVTQPLEQLSQATRSIAAGNLDLQVSVATRDEVGELAAAFNTMVRRLKTSREEIEEWNRRLEARVEDRTRSLRAAQRELETVNEQLVLAMRKLRDTQDSMVRTEKLAAVGQLASTIAHEIRNPLAGIRGALELVIPELEHSIHRGVLEQIIEEVDRIGRTTNRLLSFARPAPPHKEWTGLKELLENTCFLVGQQARRQGVDIRIEADAAAHDVYVDPQLTTQAFLNIVLNALQAIEGKGALTIRTHWLADEGVARVTFADSGRGIPAHVRDKLFTPFFTTKRQGTGLGLHVVKSIIERQGGSVSFESQEGKGTVFTVDLQAKGPAETESET